MESSATPLIINILILLGVIIVLGMIAWNTWVSYLNQLYLKTIDWVVLEITPPKEVFKSPQAMELVLNSLHGGGAGGWYLKYWKGELAQYYSLEIASIEGSVRFYVRFHKKFKKVFEASVYAQYPQAEVKEVEDYTSRVPDFVKDGPINVFGYELGLAKDEVYPIKSYVDYGLDRAVGALKEEERIDPLTPLLEIMGSIGSGEQIWVQIIIRQDTKRFSVKNADGEVEEGKSWKDKANELIQKLRKDINPPDKEGKVQSSPTTRGQLAVLESIERHKNKLGFDTGIRVVYVADKDKFNGNTITAFTAMFRQFGNEDTNSFKLENMTRPPDEPWKDIGQRKVLQAKEGMLAAYKARAYFFGGFDISNPMSYFTHPAKSGKKPFILSTEEIATLYHLPGRVAETPTFSRIEAAKAEPPVNLPI